MRHLVLSLGIGAEGQKFLALSLPFLAAYARRIGADCRVITQPTHADPLMRNFEKFQIQTYFHDYDRILYVDADVIVLPHAPDLFAEVDSRTFAAWDESTWVPRPRLITECQTRLGRVKGWRNTLLNMGIFVASRRHARLFDPVPVALAQKVPPNASPRYSDQLYLNWNLHRLKIPRTRLAATWNWNSILGYIHPRANFVHFLGDGFFEPERDRLLPPQDSLRKRIRQMTSLSAALPDRVAAAEPAVDLCVVGPNWRSAVELPVYLLPKGTYEVEFGFRPGDPSTGDVGCSLFAKKDEAREIARWTWPAAETRVVRRFETEDLLQPHFCFATVEAQGRVSSIKIRWLGDIPRPAPASPETKSWIFRRPAARRAASAIH